MATTSANTTKQRRNLTGEGTDVEQLAENGPFRLMSSHFTVQNARILFITYVTIVVHTLQFQQYIEGLNPLPRAPTLSPEPVVGFLFEKPMR